MNYTQELRKIYKMAIDDMKAKYERILREIISEVINEDNIKKEIEKFKVAMKKGFKYTKYYMSFVLPLKRLHDEAQKNELWFYSGSFLVDFAVPLNYYLHKTNETLISMYFEEADTILQSAKEELRKYFPVSEISDPICHTLETGSEYIEIEYTVVVDLLNGVQRSYG